MRDLWRFSLRWLRKLLTIFTHVNREHFFKGYFVLHAINWRPVLLIPVRIVYRSCFFLVRILFGRVEIYFNCAVDLYTLFFARLRFCNNWYSLLEVFIILSFTEKSSTCAKLETLLTVYFWIPWALVEYSHKVFHVTLWMFLYSLQEMTFTGQKSIFPLFLCRCLVDQWFTIFLT